MFLGGFGTTAKTATILTKQGMDKKLAQKQANSMTQEQKKEFIEENMDTLMQAANDVPSVQEYTKRQELHENFINNIKQGTKDIKEIDDNYINSAAKVMSESIANLANNIDMKTEDVNKLFDFKMQTLTEEQALTQYNNDTKTLNGRIEQTQVLNQFAAMHKDYNFPNVKEFVQSVQ